MVNLPRPIEPKAAAIYDLLQSLHLEARDLQAIASRAGEKRLTRRAAACVQKSEALLREQALAGMIPPYRHV